jgi:hypothetical protein
MEPKTQNQSDIDAAERANQFKVTTSHSYNRTFTVPQLRYYLYRANYAFSLPDCD